MAVLILPVACSLAWGPALHSTGPRLRSRFVTATEQPLELSSSFNFQPVAAPVDLPAQPQAPPSLPLPVEVPLSALPLAVDVTIAPAPPFVLPPTSTPEFEAEVADLDLDAPPLEEVEEVAEPAPVPAEAEAEVTPNLPSFPDLALFAIPTLAIWLSSPLLSLIDTAVVGKVCSTAQLAALGPSTKTCDNIAYFASAIGAATTNLAADAFASRRPATAHRIVGGSLTIALALGVAICGVLRVVALPLMTQMIGAGSAAAVGGAAQYTSIRALGYPAALTTMVLQAAFLASKDATSPLLALPLVAAANLIGDLLLVGPLRMGAAGAAWATIAAQYVNAVMLLGLWKRKLTKGQPPGCGSAPEGRGAGVPLLQLPTKQEFSTLIAFIMPMMLAIGARSYMGIAVAATVATLGTASLAAHQVVECLYWLFTPFGDAVSLSVQAFLPALLKQSAALSKMLQRLAWRGASALGLLVGAAGAATLMFSPGLFSGSSVVCAICSGAAPLLGLSLVGYVLSASLEGALLARRQLRLLAASHVVNTAMLAMALRHIVGIAGCSLRHVWTIMVVLNMARVFEFGVGLRRAERDAAVREEAVAAR